LYTAITRARKLCVPAGNPCAISMAVRNNQVSQRCAAPVDIVRSFCGKNGREKTRQDSGDQ